MAVTEEMIKKAMKCLDNTVVNVFNATPATVRPGQATTLKWNVTVPDGCGIMLFLNNSRISETGTRSIEPASSTTYRLTGKMTTVGSPLGTVTVNVDTSQCLMQSVHEQTVRQMLRETIEANLAGSSLSQRSRARVEINREGIAVNLRLRIAVPKFWDADLYVDMVIAVRAVNHDVVVSYRSYSDDVDWPDFVSGITLGISKFVEEVIESRIEQKIKPMILEKVKERIDSFLDMIPSTHRLHSITTEADEIRVMVCPAA